MCAVTLAGSHSCWRARSEVGTTTYTDRPGFPICHHSSSLFIHHSLNRIYSRSKLIRFPSRRPPSSRSLHQPLPLKSKDSQWVSQASIVPQICITCKNAWQAVTTGRLTISALATNGVAPTAPARMSPAPSPNGKASPPAMEMPQSVTSTDPKIAAQQASDMRNIVRRKLTGYVGFANLPNQWHRKSVRKGFNFNVMVVGMLRYSPEYYSCANVPKGSLALESQPW
jgi:hypothetical protein